MQHASNDYRLTHVVDGAFATMAGKVEYYCFRAEDHPWAGIQLERHVLRPGHERLVFWPTTRFALVSVGAFAMSERRISRSEREFISGVGSFTMWPAGL